MYICVYKMLCTWFFSSFNLHVLCIHYFILIYLKQCKYENTILFFARSFIDFRRDMEIPKMRFHLSFFFLLLLFLDLENHGKGIMSFNRIKALQHRIPKKSRKKIKRNKCNNYLYNFHKKFDIGRYLLYFYKTKKIRKIQKKTAIQPVLMSFLNVSSKSQT